MKRVAIIAGAVLIGGVAAWLLLRATRVDPKGQAILDSLPANPVVRINELVVEALPEGDASRWALVDEIQDLYVAWSNAENARPEALRGFDAVDSIQRVNWGLWPPDEAELATLSRLRNVGYFDAIGAIRDGPIPVLQWWSRGHNYRVCGDLRRLSELTTPEMRAAAHERRGEDLVALVDSMLMLGQGISTVDVTIVSNGMSLQEDCLFQLRKILAEVELEAEVLRELDRVIEGRLMEVDWPVLIEADRILELSYLTDWSTPAEAAESAIAIDATAQRALTFARAGRIAEDEHWSEFYSSVDQVHKEAALTRVMLTIERYERTNGELPESLDAAGIESELKYVVDPSSPGGYSLWNGE